MGKLNHLTAGSGNPQHLKDSVEGFPSSACTLVSALSIFGLSVIEKNVEMMKKWKQIG